MVFRVYVEKKPGFDVAAQQLANELRTILGIEALKNVRLVNRYDVEDISEELFAQAIHNQVCPEGPFMSINCAAIPQELIESELFGYEEGAFTGARRGGKLGLFELANEGVILLDEINSLSLSAQAKLLRVLQERRVDRVGGDKSIPINVRVIAISNCPLEQMVAEGAFREDLYYRLSVFPVCDVPVSDHWYGNRLFHLTDNLPVCLTCIKLLPGSSVNCHGSHTAGFCNFRNFHCVHRGIIKPFPEFDCHRLVYLFYKSCENLLRQFRVFHQGRTLSVIHYLRHRAAHIEINNIKGAVFNQVRHIADNLRIRAEKLYGNRTFSRCHL